MTSRFTIAAGTLLAGFLVGGVAAYARFEKLDDKRPLCASCHHSVVELEELNVQPPHSTDFDAGCHGCHVLPVKQYLQRSFAVVGMDSPGWVDGMENPTFGGQTCLECHLARGRGIVACEQCHADGTLDVRLDDRCDACHVDRLPIEPHTRPACRDCHVEVYMDPHGRTERLMEEKLGHHGGTHDHE